MLSFDKIVNKMGKLCGKVLNKDDIFSMIDPEKKKIYASRVDKIVYRLKAQGIIISIKAGVYIVPDKEDLILNKIDLLEKYYYKLLKKYITLHCGSSYYLSGKKALEIHMKNLEVPEKIYIINRTISQKVVFGNYEIIFKTISGKNNDKKINLYSRLSSFTTKKNIDGIDFKCSSLELSLLETALLSDTNEGLAFELLNKTIKKYSKVLDTGVFYEVGKYKYIMSFNRLKEISKNIDSTLYDVFLDIIKKNGGLFIGEGLRGF